MAQDQKSVVPVQKANLQGSSGMSGARVARKHKVYSHAMTDQERFALQTVQRAQSALRVINESIKSGKNVRHDLIKLCFQLSQAAGDMLFGTE